MVIPKPHGSRERNVQTVVTQCIVKALSVLIVSKNNANENGIVPAVPAVPLVVRVEVAEIVLITSFRI